MSAARRRTLDKYVKEAPPSASELYQGDFWQKNHVGKREGTSASEHDCEYLGTKIFFMCRTFYIKKGHPMYVNRAAGANRNQQGYFPHLRKNDLRLAYKNPNLPWIVALHRFEIRGHYPQSADTAHFRFPPGTPAGQYIAYYYWGGYRDCVDIDVLPDHKPVTPTKRGIYGYRPNEPDSYIKTDHCQYPIGQYDVASKKDYTLPSDVCQTGGQPPDRTATCFAIPPEGKTNRKGQTTEQALAKCHSRCSAARYLAQPKVAYNPFRIVGSTEKTGKCEAVNVVPLTPPAMLTFPDEQNIPWGLHDCKRECFDGEPEGSSICYGLKEASKRTVETPWEVIQDDPRDEVRNHI